MNKTLNTILWSLTTLTLPLLAKAAGTYGLDDVAIPAGYKKIELAVQLNGILKTAFGLLGVLFLGMVIYGGYNWMSSMGDDEKVNEGKSTLIWATLGLIVVIGAYAISSFVITAIYKDPNV